MSDHQEVLLSGRFLRRAAVAVAVAATTAVALAAPASARSTVSLRHAPIHLARIVHATSSNWAGWDNTGGRYTTVSASWVQPTVTCAVRETSYASFWIGLDGDGSNSVEQTGSESDCVSGRATYYSWYEFYPAYPVNYTNTVRPGDHFSATVTSTSAGHYTLTLTDSTQGWTQTKTGTASSGRNASAEVIAEAPSSSSGVLPLANFGAMTFSGAKVNGAALGAVATPQKITMASGSTIKALVSNLTSNTTFSVTWKHR
ncbi:MAG TPA: G1 family glutamic endopeptidase [Jatrophihabitantaceae bacterium]|nr:G1 family glutamic endopeptidase [Jatrophihabitantaceae bacterium]